ncbi:FadR/GntR family transcriptional regulator [Frigidibacter sp. ROC022]|uniref:FadR/GntR family transcriptional regulator n=1 Tax=Frigidibacter sp. ROC022 TaxID=2971796 RepID=UPI00215B3FB3|nr:FadR/GntR family transcriptional regulator [Frigidibacter sp. ROC022]MCR8724627.1 FadR family transcriptional regulator [Frigidibacter sp. ROC022]
MRQLGQRTPSLHARIAEQLGRDIVNGCYEEGALLPGVEDLREKFGASRVIVREAIRTLGAKGLVYSRRKMGTRVANRQGWNIFDEDVLAWLMAEGRAGEYLLAFIEFRLFVEPEAASMAAKRSTKELLQPLRDSVAKIVASDGDLVLFHEGDMQFHLALLNASGNPFFAGLGRAAQTYLDTSFSLQEAGVDRAAIRKEIEMHQRLLEAIENGDADGARRECRRIILSGKEDLESEIGQESGRNAR